MSKLDERGLATLIEEINKSVNTKICGMEVSGGANVDLSGYVTKIEFDSLVARVSELENQYSSLLSEYNNNKSTIINAINNNADMLK